MLDVHILNYNPHPKWWPQCLESVKVAIGEAGYKIDLHILPGSSDFGAARGEGFSKGVNQYATYVDNDDYVLPNAFKCLHASLLKNPDAVFTREWLLYSGPHKDRELVPSSNLRHKLQVYKREHLINLSTCGFQADYRQMRAVDNKNVVDLDDRVYVWRIYGKIQGVQGTPKPEGFI